MEAVLRPFLLSLCLVSIFLTNLSGNVLFYFLCSVNKNLLVVMCFGFFLFLVKIVEVTGTTMTLYNKCRYPVWPGIQPSAGKPILARGGFKLPPNKSYTLRLPATWSGRVWGRHGCSFDASGHGRCATGDCGGALFCNGIGGAPPATLAEITLGSDQDFYDVSLVDGYNLAISITPFKGSGKDLIFTFQDSKS